jgi:hypothetical protein
MSSEDALTIILAVTAQSDAVDSDHLTLPGSPGDSKPISIHQVDDWTAAAVRAVLSSVASAHHEAHADDPRNVADLLDDAACAAEDAAAALHKDITTAELAAARLARERCVPPPDAVDRIIRYEAHVARQLTTALHELEALQKRRNGEPAPLHRGDISGDPEALSAKQTP